MPERAERIPEDQLVQRGDGERHRNGGPRAEPRVIPPAVSATQLPMAKPATPKRAIAPATSCPQLGQEDERGCGQTEDERASHDEVDEEL